MFFWFKVLVFQTVFLFNWSFSGFVGVFLVSFFWGGAGAWFGMFGGFGSPFPLFNLKFINMWF